MNIRLEYKNIYEIIIQIINQTEYLLSVDSYENKSFLEDIVLTEMNDLLLGIEQNQIYMTNSGYLLATRYLDTDGAIKDERLRILISELQGEIYKNKQFIKYYNYKHSRLDTGLSAVLGMLGSPMIIFPALAISEKKSIYWILSVLTAICAGTVVIALIHVSKRDRKRNTWCSLFPNLPVNDWDYVFSMDFKDEDMLTIGNKNSIEFNLGYFEKNNKYYISIRERNVTVEEIEISKRYLIEKILFEKMQQFKKC